jgi:hypothetical protein
MTIVGEDTGGTLGLGSTSTVGDGEGCSAVLVASGIAVAGGTVGLETASAAGDVIVGAVSWSLQATNRSRTETISKIEIPFETLFMVNLILCDCFIPLSLLTQRPYPFNLPSL